MELESLELANKEMVDTMNNLEKEVQSYTTPSLHSIHSEDLLCLSKIRQLAQEELNLKNCVKELEQKETVFKDHIDRLLASKEYRNACRRKIASCIPDLPCIEKGPCCMPKKCLLNKPTAGQRSQKKEEQDEDIISENTQTQSDAVVSTSEHNINKRNLGTENPELSKETLGKKTSWIPSWFSNNNQKTEEVPQTENPNPPASSNAENNKVTKSDTVEKGPKEELGTARNEKPAESVKAKAKAKAKSKSAQCHRPCITPQDLQSALKKSCLQYNLPPCNIPCSKPFRSCCPTFMKKPLFRTVDHGIRGCKAFTPPCEICPSLPFPDYSRPAGNCRCNCKGKCASGLSDAPCNCSADPLGPSEEYQPIGCKRLADSRKEVDSEDEFCECCMCGCEDSDESLCQCD